MSSSWKLSSYPMHFIDQAHIRYSTFTLMMSACSSSLFNCTVYAYLVTAIQGIPDIILGHLLECAELVLDFVPRRFFARASPEMDACTYGLSPSALRYLPRPRRADLFIKFQRAK